MSEHLITLAELSESLQVSPDLIYKWELSIPMIRPRLSEGGRRYDTWEVEVLKQAKGFFIGYQHDLERTRVALERWVSRHPRPEPPALAPDEDFFGDLASAAPPLVSYEPVSTARELPAPPSARRTGAARSTPHATPQPPAAPAQGALTSARAHLMSLNVGVGDDDAQVWKAHFQQAQLELRRAHEELERARETLQQQHAAIKQIQGEFNALKELIRKEIYDLRDLVVDNG
jgi:hypothetical protein